MTEKQKAEAYNKALEKAREALKDWTINSITIAYLQDIFPELKESEDEKIRKALLEMVYYTPDVECKKIYNIDKEKCITWLEKQSEKEQLYIRFGEIPTDEKSKIYQGEIEIPFGAKDRELQEATYYIPKGFHAEIDNDKVVIKKGEKSAEWSEKDEHWRQKAIDLMEHPYLIKAVPTLAENTIDWLKSLEDRYTWKPSDEQMHVLEELVEDSTQRHFYHTLKSLHDDLKKKN